MLQFTMESPWYTFGKKLHALFEQDMEIDVGDVYKDEQTDDYAVDICVLSHEKFVALDRVMPKHKDFGNVGLDIKLFDLENDAVDPDIEIYRAIFKDNPIVKEIVSRSDKAGFTWNYVCFQPTVTQFFDDDLSDVNGNYTGLAMDIAREVFDNEHRGINFCTAAVDAADKSTEE